MTEVWLRASLTHDIIDQAQYSYLIAAVIGSAAVPTFGGERVLRATIPAADGGEAVDCRAGAARCQARRAGGIMIATRILVGHDGSRDAETAFENALDLAALARARLSVVIKWASQHGMDLIVVGHRGRSAIAEWVSESTSRRVVAHAKGPVLVVRAR